ncbi:MAG: hypothetical protein L3J17_11340 [Candidatus Jettenia sp.]|nr:MAG: hypothetical protein L3J17_11340 [Candidatus Jettenia sp.]
MDGIKRLEYRGYNFSGIAFIEDGALKYEKTVGRIAELEKKLLGNNFHPLEVEYASEFRYPRRRLLPRSRDEHGLLPS